MLEASRTYKWIWVPAVFLLLGIMRPVSTYYLPDILTMAGELPPEAAALFTVPSAENVMASTLSQFSTIGLLVLVLAGMNTVAGERATGTAELVLARSVSTIPMMSAKWAALMTPLVVSLRLDLAVPHITRISSSVLWNGDRLPAAGLICCMAGLDRNACAPLGAVLRGPVAAFISLAVAGVLSLLSGLLPSRVLWSPGRLSGMAAERILGAGAARGHRYSLPC